MRFPRPHRFMRVSVRSLSRKLGIGEATANHLHHGESKTVLIGERIVLRIPIIESKYLLRNVAVKVEGFDGNVGSLQTALQEAPEVLNSLGMNLAAHILIEMVYRFVYKVLFVQVPVRAKTVRVYRGPLIDVSKNLVLQSFALYIWDDLGADSTGLAVTHPEKRWPRQTRPIW